MHDALKPYLADARRQALRDEAARHHRATLAGHGGAEPIPTRGARHHAIGRPELTAGATRMTLVVLVVAITVVVAAALLVVGDGFKAAGIMLNLV